MTAAAGRSGTSAPGPAQQHQCAGRPGGREHDAVRAGGAQADEGMTEGDALVDVDAKVQHLAGDGTGGAGEPLRQRLAQGIDPPVLPAVDVRRRVRGVAGRHAVDVPLSRGPRQLGVERTDLRLGVLVLPERPHLHGPDGGHGMPRGRLDRLLQAVALQDVEPGDVLLRLRERTVAAQHLTPAHPHGDGLGGEREAVAVQAYPAVSEVFHPGFDGGDARGVGGESSPQTSSMYFMDPPGPHELPTPHRRSGPARIDTRVRVSGIPAAARGRFAVGCPHEHRRARG